MPRNTEIKFRRGTASEWSTANPVLAVGEPGFDTTNSIFKIGDGSTAWNSLDAANNSDHPNISAAGSVNNAGNQFVQDITVDSNGHITGMVSATASAGIGNVVEDTSPQLGGNLDAQSNEITAVSKLEIENTSTDDSLLITTTEDSATAAPVLTFKRNSSSPDDADYLGQLKFKGENDADQEVVYAKVTAKISDATDTTEDGLIEFALRKAGSNNICMRLTSTELKMLNGTSLDMGSQPIENVTDPSSAQDAATKNYVDSNALMDSEVTNLAQVKAFDSSDYAAAGVVLTAGDGLTGGGDLSANRTFAVNVDDSTIEINSDALRIKDGAITSAKIGAGGFVFNEAGAAVDFRIEGDTEQNLLFVDGSEDRIGIGTDSPDAIVHVKGEFSNGSHIMIEDTSSELKTIFYNGNTASVIAVDAADAVGSSSFMIQVDGDTKGTFGASATTFDQNVTINASTNQAIVGNSITVFNEGGANVDFRVEGDTDANLLFGDASTDRVGIGTSTPAYLLDVDGQIGADSITVGESNKYFTMARHTGGTFGIARIHELLGSFEVMIGANTAALEITNHSVGSPVVTINPAGIDMDFVVEGDSDTNLIYADASTDRVGIGTNSPSKLLDVDGVAKAKSFVSDYSVESDASTVTFDLDSSNHFEVVLGGNRTLALSNSGTAGQKFTVKLKQDGTGSRTVTWFSTINWPGGLVPTLSTAANKADTFGFICTASNTYDGFVLAYEQ